MLGMLLASVQWTRVGEDLGIIAVFGLAAVVMLIIGYKLFDKVERKLDFVQLIKEGNIAMAIVIAGFMLAVSGVIVAAMLMP